VEGQGKVMNKTQEKRLELLGDLIGQLAGVKAYMAVEDKMLRVVWLRLLSSTADEMILFETAGKEKP